MNSSSIPKQSVVIRASAGSGKTYQLSLRYIALLALGTPPAEIIALTFTKKAAGEFTERILQMLAEGASSEEKSSELADKIINTWRGSSDENGNIIQPPLIEGGLSSREEWPRLDKDYFTILLKSLVLTLGRLNLSTLDSFFGSMAMMLSTEIGLSSFRMIDEARLAQIRARVILSLFHLDATDAIGRDELLNQFRLATLNSNEDRMDRKMMKFVEDYHQRFRQLPRESCWGGMDAVYGVSAPWEPPKYAPEEFPSIVHELCPQLEKISPEPPDKKPSARHGNWIESRKKDLLKFSDYGEKRTPVAIDPSTFFSLEKTFWENARNGSYTDSYYNKTYDFGPVLGQNIVDLIISWSKSEIQSASDNTKGIYQLIRRYDSSYESMVRSTGLFSFDDITRFLLNDSPEHSERELLVEEELENLRYRMDGWYTHWMLDEFQDTSQDQWTVLKPFLEEVAMDPEHTRSIFIVGDPKQSIYQWRGGEPRIFDSLFIEEPWKSTLAPWNMDASYRSSQVILDFANLACDFNSTAPNAGKALERWFYNPHIAGGNNKSLTGHVQIWTVKDDKEENTRFNALSTLLRRLQPLERKLTCAIIVNSNDENAKVTHWLRSSEGGGFQVEMDSEAEIGKDSPAGSALADFFRWLNHPADKFAWSHIVISPLGRHLNTAAPQDVWHEWARLRDKEGIQGIVLRWYQTLSNDHNFTLNHFQQNRLEAWLDAARAFDQEGGSLDEWISLMENIRRKESSSAQSIQVMTIHKSKGLEFDIVILPFIKNDRFDNKTHLDFISRTTEDGKTRAFLCKPGGGSYLYDSRLSELAGDWEDGQRFEGFCKLYVALTRAKRATYAFVPPAPSKASGSISVGDILRSACDQANAKSTDLLEGWAEDCLYSKGNNLWHEESPIKSPSPQEEETNIQLPPPLVRPNAASPSREGHSAAILNEEAAQRGTHLHAMFERIDWLEPESLPDFLSASTPEARIIRDCLDVPEIRSLFTRPDSTDVLLLKEHPVSGYYKGKYYTGIVDRVSFINGQLTLIDFKSDECDSPTTLLQRHSKQMEIYKHILQNALSLKEDQIKTCIISSHFKKLITLP